jgi:hypothetical protein
VYLLLLDASVHTYMYFYNATARKQAVRTVRGSVPGIIEAEDFDDDHQGIYLIITP